MKKRNEKPADPSLSIATAAITFAAAFGVSGGTHLWMMLTKNDLIKKYRATLTFRSAWFGDGIILPAVNVLMMKSLRQWKPRMSESTLLDPMIGGSAISLMFHIGQGRGGLVNWTMTRPWRWNLLGYYHFIYMSTQFSYMLLYLTQLAGRWSKGEITDEQKRDLKLIAALMLAFGAFLYTDYY